MFLIHGFPVVPHVPRITADLKGKMRVAMQKCLASNQHAKDFWK
jgi:hypothetical protein